MTMLQLSVIILCAILSGCNSSEAPHFLQSKEMQCLQSEALNFKDPTSLKVVKNLGDRRGAIEPADTDKFWLFYAAKNGYGAYGTQSMACEKTSQGWIRSNNEETLARLDVYNSVLKKMNSQLDLCNALFEDKSKRSAAMECHIKIKTKYGDHESMLSTADKIATEHVKSAKNLDSIEAYD